MKCKNSSTFAICGTFYFLSINSNKRPQNFSDIFFRRPASAVNGEVGVFLIVRRTEIVNVFQGFVIFGSYSASVAVVYTSGYYTVRQRQVYAYAVLSQMCH